MAGSGPKVTLTFAGDSSNLSRSIKAANRETESFAKTVNRSSNIVGIAGLGMMGAVSTGAVGAAAALAAVPIAFGALGIAAAAQSEKVKTAFSGLKDHVTSSMQRLAEPLVPVLTDIAGMMRSTFDQIAPSLGAIFRDVGPMLKSLAEGIMSLVTGAMPGFQTAMSAARPVIEALKTGLAEMGPALSQMFTNMASGSDGAAAGFRALFDTINWLLPALGSFFGFITNNSQWLMPLGGILLGVAAALRVVTIAQAAWNIALTANPIGLVVVAIGALVAALVFAWNNSETFRRVVLSVWGAVKTAISASVNWIKGAVAWFGELPGKASAWFGGMRDSAVSRMQSLMGFIRGIPGMILGALGGLGSLLVNSGRALLEGLWRGVQNALGWVKSKISGALSSIRNLFPFSPAKEGPFSGSGYTTHSGLALAEDFARGITSGTPAVHSAAAGLVSVTAAQMTRAGMVQAEDGTWVPRSYYSGGSGAGLGNVVRMGSVSDATWKALRAAGWKGRAGDNMEAIYRPSGGSNASVSTAEHTVTFHGNTSDALANTIMHMIRTGRIQISGGR